jgi:uridine kinase
MKFIFLFGLPGSGKTTLIENIKKQFHISPVVNLIDELVQRDDMYKTQVEKVLRKCKGRCLKKHQLNSIKKLIKKYNFIKNYEIILPLMPF